MNEGALSRRSADDSPLRRCPGFAALWGHSMSLKRHTIAIVVATVALTLTTTTATAVLVGFTGGSMIQREVRTETAAASYSRTVFAIIPRAELGVNVPSGSFRLVTACFTAESSCSGTVGGWCSVRIV